MLNHKILVAALLSSLLAACGGGLGGTDETGGGTSTGGSTTPTPSAITLITNTASLASGAATVDQGITITALVKDSSNNLMSAVPVSFSTTAVDPSCGSGGGIHASTTTTDGSGQVTAVLTAGGDRQNQVIKVSATATGLTTAGTINIPVTGTGVQITGPSALSLGSVGTYTVKLLDSNNLGISGQTIRITPKTSTASPAGLGNIAAAGVDVITDATGIATFNYTGTHSGADVLTAFTKDNSCNAAGQQALTVSGQTLVFTAPSQPAEVVIGAAPITVTVKLSGTDINAKTITFSAAHGTLNGTSATIATGLTDSAGVASVTLQQASSSDGAPSGSITATGPGGITAVLPFAVVSHSPAAMTVQVSNSNIPVVTGTSDVTATVTDDHGNPVKDTVVNFSLVAPGGSLSSATAPTDSNGKAAVVYSASSSSSATGGVTITATVTRAAPLANLTSTTNLTVAGNPISITFGISNKAAPDPDNPVTANQLPILVTVVDSAGSPPPAGTTVSFTLKSTAYQKGGLICGQDGKTPPWTPVFLVSGNRVQSSSEIGVTPFGCLNEDKNLDGTLQAGEDYNGDNMLEPGAVASAPRTVTLDATGRQTINVSYPKDHAYWVQVKLSARVVVAGTENTVSTVFLLPGIASDYASCDVAAPGEVSPYGFLSSDCTSNDNSPVVGLDSNSANLTITPGTAGNATLTVRLSAVSDRDVSVPYTCDGTIKSSGFLTSNVPSTLTTGTATPTFSSTSCKGSLTIPAGMTSGTIKFGYTSSVTVGQTLIVKLGGIPTNALISSNATTDDGATSGDEHEGASTTLKATLPSVQFGTSDVSVTHAAASQPVNFAVTLNAASAAAVTATLAESITTGTPTFTTVTAASPCTYAAATKVLTIPAGTTSCTMTANVTENAAGQVITFSITAASGGTVGAPASLTLTAN